MLKKPIKLTRKDIIAKLADKGCARDFLHHEDLQKTDLSRSTLVVSD
jgi:hypothetical protein